MPENNSTDFLEPMFHNMDIGVMTCREDGQVVFCNPAFTTLFRLPRSPAMANEALENVSAVIIPDKKPFTFVESLVLPILDANTGVKVQIRVSRDGSYQDIFVSGRSLNIQHGRIVMILAVPAVVFVPSSAQTGVSMNDPVTGLPGRAQLLSRLSQEVATAARHNHSGAVLLLNVDKFRTVNESFGTAVGDDLLRQLAGRITEQLREGDTAGRLGNDEYLIILHELDNDEARAADSAQQVASRILASIAEEPFDAMGFACEISAGIGIVMFPSGGDHSDEIIKNADIALSQAKKDVNHDYCFFNREMQDIADRILVLRQDVSTMIEKKEFEVLFQPIIDIREGRIVGAESLSRWHHPRYGALSPAEFIPIAEESGVIHTIGNWVLMHALRSLKHWISTGLADADMAVSVNISPSQLHDMTFVQYVIRALKIFELEPRQLKLEVTEGVLLNDTKDPVSKMNTLRQEGVRFSIDDFGTGYSSLRYIKQLPVDQLKIDRAFVVDIGTDKDDVAITESIIAIARHFGLEIIAEGVENKDQVEVLQGLGCHTFQGYYFSHPLSSNDFVTWLKDRSGQVADRST